jgi:hypothetical protein
MIEGYGRHEETRTPDLYRVKLHKSRGIMDLEGALRSVEARSEHCAPNQCAPIVPSATPTLMREWSAGSGLDPNASRPHSAGWHPLRMRLQR